MPSRCCIFLFVVSCAGTLRRAATWIGQTRIVSIASACYTVWAGHAVISRLLGPRNETKECKRVIAEKHENVHKGISKAIPHACLLLNVDGTRSLS